MSLGKCPHAPRFNAVRRTSTRERRSACHVGRLEVRVFAAGVVSGIAHAHERGYVLAQGAFNTVLERHGGSSATLAAAAEADDGKAVLHTFELHGAAMAGNAGIDDRVQYILDFLRHRVIPAGAGMEHAEAALHQALYEIYSRAIEVAC